MFWKNQEEEDFKFKPVLKQNFQATSSQQININEIMEKIGAITEQINTISKYLSYLSQKVEKTVENSGVYDKTLDEIEKRINSLREKIDELEIVSPDVDLAENRKRAI